MRKVILIVVRGAGFAVVVGQLLCCVCCVFTYRDREKRRRSLSSDAYSQEEQGEAYTSTELLDITGISYQVTRERAMRSLSLPSSMRRGKSQPT